MPLKSTASPVTVSTHSKSSLRNSTAGGVSSNRSEEHSENNPVANGPAVENCLPPARSPSELTLLRSEAKVKKLKQQFLPAKDSTSSPPLKLQSRKSPGEGMQKSQRENVKNIIAQISSATDERENLVTPPTSPIEKDFAAIQQNIIMDRISYLNQTVDEITDKRHSTYKPSTLRRKIVSPFLNQEEESYEETRTPSSSSISPERIECDSRKRGSKLNNDKQQQEVSSTSPSPDLRDIRKDKSLLSTSSVPCAGGGEDVSPEEGGDLDFNPPKIKDDLFKMDKDQLHNLLISECPTREESMLSQDQMEETVLSREHTDNENGIDMHQSDQETLEKHPVSTVHDKAVQTCHEHSNHHNWQDTPPAIPPRSATHSSTDFTRRSTVSRTPQHHRQLGSTPSTYSSSYIVEGGNDDDHLVDIVLPYRSAGSKKEERQEQFSSFRSSSVSQLKNVKPLKWPASQRNITDPTIMNDRFLSFNCLKDESRTARSQEIQKFAEDERRMSMHSVDIVLGVKENGIPSSRPRLSVSGNSQSTDHFSQSCQYDRLPKMRSDYDHLPPLEQRMDSESMYRTRTRTSSDVTQQPRPYRREDDFTASEVLCTHVYLISLTCVHSVQSCMHLLSCWQHYCFSLYFTYSFSPSASHLSIPITLFPPPCLPPLYTHHSLPYPLPPPSLYPSLSSLTLASPLAFPFTFPLSSLSLHIPLHTPPYTPTFLLILPHSPFILPYSPSHTFLTLPPHTHLTLPLILSSLPRPPHTPSYSPSYSLTLPSFILPSLYPPYSPSHLSASPAPAMFPPSLTSGCPQRIPVDRTSLQFPPAQKEGYLFSYRSWRNSETRGHTTLRRAYWPHQLTHTRRNH